MIYKYFLLITIIFTSCLKADLSPTHVETPPKDQSLTWKTIAEIRRLSTNIGTPISDPIWIEAVVVSDDKQGNFYKQIYVQDNTGGIVIRINNTPLYPQFPFGRLIRVNLLGAYVQNYYGPIQLNGGIDYAGKPMPYTALQVTQNFRLYSFLNPLPQVLTSQELKDVKYRGTLVKLEKFQVVEADTNKTYSIANFYFIRIENNNNPRDTFYLNINNNASFAKYKIPKGSGSIVGIYDTSTSTSPERQSRQIFIKDTHDIHFYNSRF
ncbi:MAG: DUF5689 domain-containing protein [Chitinophagaceae bacterium]